jgi:hypothetical protein
LIHAKLAADFGSIQSPDGVIERTELEVCEIPREALYLAGQAHVHYRRRGVLWQPAADRTSALMRVRAISGAPWRMPIP